MSQQFLRAAQTTVVGWRCACVYPRPRTLALSASRQQMGERRALQKGLMAGVSPAHLATTGGTQVRQHRHSCELS